jgi:hypothetical protein
MGELVRRKKKKEIETMMIIAGTVTKIVTKIVTEIVTKIATKIVTEIVTKIATEIANKTSITTLIDLLATTPALLLLVVADDVRTAEIEIDTVGMGMDITIAMMITDVAATAIRAVVGIVLAPLVVAPATVGDAGRIETETKKSTRP